MPKPISTDLACLTKLEDDILEFLDQLYAGYTYGLLNDENVYELESLAASMLKAEAHLEIVRKCIDRANGQHIHDRK